jgi:hypothetical protein
VFACLLALSLRAEEKISFNTHIRPILADNCFACHGPDAHSRKGKLRLDVPEGATAERNGVRAIVPGSLEHSEAWLRITSPHEDEVMPPPESHRAPLAPAQREIIRRWILEGAPYERHWAFEPVSPPALPSPAAGAGNHPVDRFIGAKLAALGLRLSPVAPPETLVRRVTLDLTGLPPSPAQIEAFLADRRPDAYERLVDRLLASPAYGEHFGRYWLDAVRYADTHGMHLDNVRTIWPYRDWVVQAFSRNLPFDQFTIEQLAGDMLPNPRIDQLVASGYNRNILSTSEAGAIEGEAEMRNTADRVDTTAAVWMGLTASCASCHDHKYDPLSQREYYSLGAIFKSLSDRVWDGNVQVAAPIAVIADNPDTQRRIHEIAAAIVPLEAAVTRRAGELKAGGLKPLKLERKPVTYEVIWAEDSDLATPDTVLAPPSPGEWRGGPGVPVAGGQRALRLEGASERPIAFTTGEVTLTVRTAAKLFVHVNLDPASPPRAISLEFVTEGKTTRAIWGDAQAFGAEVAGGSRVAGALPEPGTYAILELTADEAGLTAGTKYSGVRIAQSDGAAWWDRVGAVYTSPNALDDPLLSQSAWMRPLREGARATTPLPIRHDINFLLALSPNQQVEEEKQRLTQYYLEYIYAPWRAALEPEVHAVRRLMSEQVYYEMNYPLTLISGELGDPPATHVLIRGEYDRPGERVEPGTPAFLPPIAKSGGRVTRLDFARWLVSPSHPLTSRVIVNRFWQQLFGAGMVRTPADFGAQGDPPTHPELLDWLAGEFMATGWDVKRLVRLLVTSHTYRQESRVTPDLLQRDPDNKWLARASRLRLDAEVLRDQALAISGLLVPVIGGPPVRPYQPVNVWEPVAFGGSNTKTYVQDHGPDLYRRSLYTFWKRTAPAPAMVTFDAPARETFCVGRSRSNTPLQALALMNDVQQFEAARVLAGQLLLRSGSDSGRLAYAFRCVTGRQPDTRERTLLAEALAVHRAQFAKNTEAAAQVLRNGESPVPPTLPVAEFAAWTMLANLLLNLDETVTRN